MKFTLTAAILATSLSILRFSPSACAATLPPGSEPKTFRNSCSIYHSIEALVFFECDTVDPNWRRKTMLDLNSCVGNNQGVLVEDKAYRNFQNSCRNVRVRDTYMLLAECRNLKDEYPPSSFDLLAKDFLTYTQDGHVMCKMNGGNKVSWKAFDI